MNVRATTVRHAIEDEMIDARFKGFPGDAVPERLGDIAAHRWNLRTHDLPLPLLVARRAALDHNIAVMQQYCDSKGLLLAPHGKTSLAPQLFDRQLRAGAWGITAATAEQLQVYRYYGIKRVIFANQLVGEANLRYVCSELAADPAFELHVFVDSVQTVGVLAAAARRYGLARPIDVLVEIGFAGGRSGTRSHAEFRSVVEAIQNAGPFVRLTGVAGYEGLLAYAGGSPQDRTRRIAAMLGEMAHEVDNLRTEQRLPERFIVTAAGSNTFDHVADAFAGRWGDACDVILESGCYVTHDHGMYARTSPLRDALRPALELWSYVHTVPEPGTAYLTFGKRDAPTDAGLPTPLSIIRAGSADHARLTDAAIESVADQHARLTFAPSNPVAVGDIIVCGISHPCLAFDKWRLIYEIDDDDTVTGALLTFF